MTNRSVNLQINILVSTPMKTIFIKNKSHLLISSSHLFKRQLNDKTHIYKT